MFAKKLSCLWQTRAKMSKIIDRLFYQTHSLEYRKVFISLLEQDPNAKFLDLGCGNGEITVKLAEALGTKSVHGIDKSVAQVEEANARGVNAIVADLNRPLPLQDESFDVICSSDIIEHVYNTDLFLREAHRILSRSGYIVISTSNLAASHCIYYLIRGWQPPAVEVSDEIKAGAPGQLGKSVGLNVAGHYRIFTLKALKEMMEYHKFKVEEDVGIGYYPFPIRMAKVLSAIDKKHAAYICVKARKL